jgi:hypothetical protein
MAETDLSWFGSGGEKLFFAFAEDKELFQETELPTAFRPVRNHL